MTRPCGKRVLGNRSIVKLGRNGEGRLGGMRALQAKNMTKNLYRKQQGGERENGWWGLNVLLNKQTDGPFKIKDEVAGDQIGFSSLRKMVEKRGTDL